MRILFDGRVLDSTSSGVRDVAQGLVEGFRALNERGEVELIVASDVADSEIADVHIPSRAFMEAGLPMAALTKRVDRILVPRQTVPVVSLVPAVPVFHDIGFIQRPDLYPDSRRISMTTRIAARSRRGLAVSEYTAAELASRSLGRSITPLPIQAIHLCRWAPQSERKYLLCVAAQEPHKNLVRLIRAWNVAETHGVRLILCGRPGKDSRAIARYISESPNPRSIEVRSGLPSSEYADLLEQCWGYVQPSFYEGLCIPALDLAAAGVPMAVSQDSNLGTVFRGSPDGQLFDPLSVSQIAFSLQRLIEDRSFRAASSSFNQANVHQTDWTQVATLAIQGMK